MKGCEICGRELVYRWTDTHGIGACVSCGAPYKLYHYEDTTRVEKPPELLILPEYVGKTKEYWETHKRNVAPGCFNFPGSSYEVASEEDFETAREFWAAQKREASK